jgi:PBS lyase HEAT-like repeat
VTVFRVYFLAGFAIASLGLAGCLGTWDTLSSRRFRDHPFLTVQHMWQPEDPVLVLRSVPPRDGDERAAAMRRLKEPIRNKGTKEDQDAILDILARAAISDPSPVLRLDAIGALGRFEDPRAAGILLSAYQTAHGRREGEAAPPSRISAPEVIQTGASAGRLPVRGSLDRFPITGPTGFPPEWVTAIRCRSVESLGATSSPEAAKFLAAVAGASGRDIAPEGSEDREVRIAAVRGLGRCRQPESVVALAQVLSAEHDKQDIALIGRTHEGLVRLTGKKLPPDPQKWNEVVQAGVVIAPEPSWWDDMVEQAARWVK